ncbi:leucine-rich repeat protein 1-like [Drosophila tropicalis]|uniref:leucine-rich repeat protein 1-like n=1 Tax=Drosophila tropicalis TaxID=46794 RepID=UPI0035ABC082
MKILCEVQVVNRVTQANRTPRAVKSTLAIGYKQSALDSNGNTKKELEMILFTPQIKTGQRYKVKDNIQAVHTKFVLDGKATIAFTQPAENLLIKCDPIQLKGFLQTLKLGMEGKDAINLRLNIATATAITQKAKLQTKMVINRRSDYPIKGFPRSLQSLTINKSQLGRLSSEIYSLRNLTHLDVANNHLAKIPMEVGRLPLTKLVLHGNYLGQLNYWSFLNGIKLSESLCELDLSANKLTYLPLSLLKCQNLVLLNLNHNNLTFLPFAMRRLKKLHSLNVSDNKLESLPAALEELHINTLDVCGNAFKGPNDLDIQRLNVTSKANTRIQCSPQPLWLQAARSVDQYKLPIYSLPAILIKLIVETPKCVCGNFCYLMDSQNIYKRIRPAKFEGIKNYSYSPNQFIYVDIVKCGYCKNVKSCA